jgi:uncharacterized protein YcgI (DUF1989 family)
MMRALLVGSCVVLLSACGESDQAQRSGDVNDIHASQGAKNAYVAVGWAPGDKNAWQAQLRTRAQLQNEYQKINN